MEHLRYPARLLYRSLRHYRYRFQRFAEEFGLVGVLLLISTYLLIVLRGLVIAYESRDCLQMPLKW